MCVEKVASTAHVIAATAFRRRVARRCPWSRGLAISAHLFPSSAWAARMTRSSATDHWTTRGLRGLSGSGLGLGGLRGAGFGAGAGGASASAPARARASAASASGRRRAAAASAVGVAGTSESMTSCSSRSISSPASSPVAR